MDLEAIVTTLGSTAIAIAAIGFVAKSIFNHILKRASDAHAEALKQQSAQNKAEFENELKEKSEKLLLEQKKAFEKEMEVFRSEIDRSSSKADRIRDEVVRWSNPILASIHDLIGRLDNILNDSAHPALSKESNKESQISGWSITSDYFFPSTVFLFCQYFCWTRLLLEDLSFELFEKHEVKDNFFERLRKASGMLSWFPLDELSALDGLEEDKQIFSLQQRLLGEMVVIGEADSKICMSYAKFLDKYDDEKFRDRLQPLINFLEDLQPDDLHRWRRLELFRDALNELSSECRKLLNIKSQE